MDPQTVALGLTSYFVLLLSLSVHESAHAWMALQMGDDTAYREGRITLNPLAHIDPVGTVLIPLLQIFGGAMLGGRELPLLGWAKPTPVAGHNLRRLARGHILVAAAGPLSNMALAILFTLALFLASRLGLLGEDAVRAVLFIGIGTNVSLAIFNLIPIPPLDGSWIASWGLPRGIANHYDRVMEPYGYVILMGLYMTGVLRWVISPITFGIRSFLLGLVV
jgi:Zn-dependent protease